jgi:hypothetical protein
MITLLAVLTAVGLAVSAIAYTPRMRRDLPLNALLAALWAADTAYCFAHGFTVPALLGVAPAVYFTRKLANEISARISARKGRKDGDAR